MRLAARIALALIACVAVAVASGSTQAPTAAAEQAPPDEDAAWPRSEVSRAARQGLGRPGTSVRSIAGNHTGRAHLHPPRAPTQTIRGLAALWQVPPDPSRVLFVAHGCNHSAEDWFDPSPACSACLGLPEERLVRLAALRRGYAVVAVSSLNRDTKCWHNTAASKSEDLQVGWAGVVWVDTAARGDAKAPRCCSASLYTLPGSHSTAPTHHLPAAAAGRAQGGHAA